MNSELCDSDTSLIQLVFSTFLEGIQRDLHCLGVCECTLMFLHSNEVTYPLVPQNVSLLSYVQLYTPTQGGGA